MPNDALQSNTQEAAKEFISNAPCGFLSFNDNGNILLLNDRLRDLLGYTPAEVDQMHIEKLLSVAGRIFYQTHFFPLLKLRGSVEEIYLALRTKSGEDIPVLVNATRRQHGDAHINHCVMLSMLERRKFEDELIAARKQVEEAAKLKDEFLAMVSHELRTPLTAVMGWIHILEESLDDPELVRNAVTVIERNATIQNRLVEDLLDFSRVTAGKLRLDVAPVDLHSVVTNALDVVRPAAEAKEIRLISVLDPNAGPVNGDANRLQQVIWNLLSNAIKFTPKQGKVQIELRRVNSHAEITIHDNGSGIDKEFLPFVFERFRQEDNSRTRKHGGLGLGLAITKEIVELHGGTISAHSGGPGQGADFSVHLPVPSAHSIGLSADSPKPAQKGSVHADNRKQQQGEILRGLTILVIDDIQESLELVARILQRAGATVRTGISAKQAMDELMTELPDVLVSDLGMPEMDGYDLLTTIRSADQPMRVLPAIALSALVTDADRLRAVEVGYQAFLAKPVNPKELVLTISNLAKIRAFPLASS